MRRFWTVTSALVFAFAAIGAGRLLLSSADARVAGGGASKSDCYQEFDGVTLDANSTNKVTCVDGDPSCDTDGKCDGTCTFKIRSCLAQKDISGCTPGTIKKARASSGIVAPPTPTSSAVCGAFATVSVKTRKKGKKPGKKVISGQASSDQKPRVDKDKFTIICKPRTGACPTTTTSTIAVTTTSTSTSTTTTLVCGNGALDPGEDCDLSTGSNACMGAQPTCAFNCKCVGACAGFTKLRFTTGVGTTSCGGPALTPPPAAPFSGEVDGATSNKLSDLGSSCLYLGGAKNTTTPPSLNPDGGANVTTTMCTAGGAIVLSGNATGSPKTCTKAAGPGKHCLNDNAHPACTGAGTDCGGNPVACVSDTNCFFGPPLSIPNTVLSTCTINQIRSDFFGTADKTTGAASMTIPLTSLVYLTGSAFDDPMTPVFEACPRCVAGACTGGEKSGMPCTPTGSQLVSPDCPPNTVQFIGALPVTLASTNTGDSMQTAADGVFCPGQVAGVPPDGNAGAFGNQNVRKIIEHGTAAMGGTIPVSPAPAAAARLAAIFCVPATGNVVIDSSADLPGPGATSLPGTVQLLP